MHSNYFDTLRTLSQPIRATDLPQTLEPMRRLLDALDNPQQNFQSIVVTGSTGKGTTCLKIAYEQQAHRKKVGLYTSPHLHLFRERFAILDPSSDTPPSRNNGATKTPPSRIIGATKTPSPRIITQQEFTDLAQMVFAAQKTLDHRYSTFESATAIALLWFAQQHIEIAVLEIGIGGRFDAVNAVANVLAIFTPIETEHVAMLGGSLESIAWHKAGIIQPNGKAITVPQVPEVMAVLEREAAEKHAVLEVADNLIDSILPSPRLRGRGVGGEGALPGRLEAITVNQRHIIIDGGHTLAAARHLREYIGAPDSIRMVIGMLRDKNVTDYLSVFDAPNVHFVYTRAPSDRALSPDQLLERYQPTQASVTLIPDLDEAFAQVNTAPETLIVVAGSLRMAAAAREAYGLLSPDDLEEARLTRAIFDGEEYQKKLVSN